VKGWIVADPLRAVLTVIGLVTVLTGATQVVAPGVVLRPLGAEVSPATGQLFATVGMFMVIIGGLLTQTLLSHQLLGHRPSAVVVGWSALQKLGASIAVPIGVARGVFGTIAVGVALFDLVTAVLLVVYWRRVSGAGQLRPVGGMVAS
jgi:hypothetical protein